MKQEKLFQPLSIKELFLIPITIFTIGGPLSYLYHRPALKESTRCEQNIELLNSIYKDKIIKIAQDVGKTNYFEKNKNHETKIEYKYYKNRSYILYQEEYTPWGVDRKKELKISTEKIDSLLEVKLR